MRILLLCLLLATPAAGETRIHPDVAPEIDAGIRAGRAEAMARLPGLFGTPLPPFEILAAPDVARLRSLSEARIGRSCDGGFTRPGRIFLCTDTPGFMRDRRGSGPTEIASDVTLHEAVHILQFALTEGAGLGPLWIVEGLAVEVVLRRRVAERRQSAGGVARLLLGRAHRAEAPFAAGNPIDDPLRISAAVLAVRGLWARAGPEGFTTYWREIGRGAAWQDAFEIAFGIAPATFTADCRAALTALRSLAPCE